MVPEIQAFFDEQTFTVSYLVARSRGAARRRHRSGTGFRCQVRPHRDTVRRSHSRRRKGQGSCHRLDPGDPRACRSSLRGAVSQIRHRREDRDRRTYNAGSESLRADLRRRRRDGGQRLLRPASEGWRDARRRRPRRRSDGDARPYARLRQLQDRRQCLCRRHAVHARLRHGTDGFSRRRRAPALPLDPAHSRPCPRYPVVDVPRLQGAGPRRLCLADQRGGGAGEKYPHP